MKHSSFVEIVTVCLFLLMFFNWHKIYVRTKLRVKRFIRRHIIARQDPDLDLDFIPESKVQPTGNKNQNRIPDPENKFLITVQLEDINFTYRDTARLGYKNYPIL